jgi:hypothetical protein
MSNASQSMPPLERAADPAPDAASFVLLRAGALRLLLPREDVGAAEYLEHAPSPTAAAGRFEYRSGDASRMVAALSAGMRPLESFPAGRFVVTPLSVEGDPCFAWDEVRVLIDARLEPRPLPPALRAPDGPIQSYAAHEGEILLCTTARRLLAYAAGAGA